MTVRNTAKSKSAATSKGAAGKGTASDGTSPSTTFDWSAIARNVLVSRAIDEPTTLTAPRHSAPRCRASWRAASVSAVSPDCETTTDSPFADNGCSR